MKSTWSLAAGDSIVNGSCNFPAVIVNLTSVTPVLSFGTTLGANNSGIAAAVIDFGRNQQQMFFFLPCGSWPITCDTIGHLWFQWATYGFYSGIRRSYFTPQIDDFFLTASGNSEEGVESDFRLSSDDIQGLIDWQPKLNARLPLGSNITLEIGFNGMFMTIWVPLDASARPVSITLISPLEISVPVLTVKTITTSTTTTTTSAKASVKTSTKTNKKPVQKPTQLAISDCRNEDINQVKKVGTNEKQIVDNDKNHLGYSNRRSCLE
ncbi:hypothetical protein HK100_004603 [Physocladia obscura]|uniref:Uncharacterized protein n=1 Tax=Physocladia obscura TaxID=109957 RepID=A0AAD5SVG0_9FUNG|nr:hypothetical protein HK100_004603 [Physocladia obscura]